MLPEYKIVGFDARISPEKPDQDWSLLRRQSYLLRDKIDRPLSVDQTVWKTAIHAADEPGKWRGVLKHWSELDDLLESIQTSPNDVNQPMWLIATTIIWDVLSTDMRDFWLGECIEPTIPSTTPPGSVLLGYDIADRWLLSGLSNCGYVGDELLKWRSRWSGQINDHHLFTDVSEAIAFSAETNARVSEHAPFFVYGLFRLPENSTAHRRDSNR